MSSPGERRQFRPIPFHQVFDVNELSATGLRFVQPLACIEHGIEAVFDDDGEEGAILDKFATFIMESYPLLVQENDLVRRGSKGYRFLSSEKANSNASVIAEYIRRKLPNVTRRHCIGVGRLQAPIGINPDVLERFSSSKEISRYVDEKYSHLNRNAFCEAPVEQRYLQTGTHRRRFGMHFSG